MRSIRSNAVTRAVAVALGLAVLAQPARGWSQIWIGQIAGEMAARQAEIAREQACRAGAPAPPKDVLKATTNAEALMKAYFDLSSSSPPEALKKVFATKQNGLLWGDINGYANVMELGARLDIETPTLKSVNFVVAGDGTDARGIWEATPTDGGAITYYAVDFSAVPNAIWGSSWRIWHMTVLPTDKPPAPAGAYCHFDPDQIWRIE